MTTNKLDLHENYLKQVKAWIKTEREARGWTHRDLGRKIGMSAQGAYRLENHAAGLTLRTLVTLMFVFDRCQLPPLLALWPERLDPCGRTDVDDLFASIPDPRDANGK